MGYQALGSMVVDLLLNNSQFRAGLRQSQDGLTDFQRNMKSVGEKVSGVGKTLTKTLTVPLVGIATAATKTAADFEQQMSNVKSVSGATGQEMDKLRKLAIQMGKDTAFGAKDAAKGQEELLKAGLSVSQVMNGGLKGALTLASAGELDLGEAAGIASNALNSFKRDGLSMSKVADIMAGAANASATDVRELQMGLSQCSAVASGSGLTFKDTSTALAVFANNGLKGSDAGTSLKTMLLNLQPTTDKAATLMQKLGLVTKDGNSAFYDAKGHIKSMADISQILHTQLGGLTDAQRQMALKTMFGTDAIRAANILYKEGGKGITDMANAMGKVSAADVAKEKLNNLKGTLTLLKGTFQTIGIQIGDLFLPTLKKLANNLNTLSGKFISLSPSMQKTIVVIAGVAAAIGPLLLVLGKVITIMPLMGKAIGAICSPAGLIVIAIAGVVTAIAYLWKTNSTFRTNVTKAWQDISASAQTIFVSLQKFWKTWGGTITALFKNTMSLVGSIFSTALNVISNVFKIFSGIFTGNWKKTWQGIKGLFSSIIGGLGDIASKAFVVLVNAIAVATISVVKVVKNVVKAILGGFGSLAKSLFDIGKHAITGFINGIKSMVGAVVDKAKDVAGTIVGGIKGALGIHSPSRVLHQVGIYTIEGLVNGMNSKKKDVSEASKQMAFEITKKLQHSKLAKKAGIDTYAELIAGMKSQNENVRRTANMLAEPFEKALQSTSKTVKKHVQDIATTIKNVYGKAISELDNKVKALSKPTTDLQKNSKNLANAIKLQKTEISKVTEEYNKLVKAKGKNDTASVATYKKLQQEKTQLKGLQTELDKTNNKIKLNNANKLVENIQNKFSPAIQKLQTEIKKLGISTGNNNTDLKNTQKAMVDTHQKAQKLRKEYAEIVKVKGKNSTEAKNLIKQIDNEGVAYDKLKQKAVDLTAKIKEEAEKRKQAQIDNINKLNDKVVKALQKRYETEEKTQENSINKQVDALDKWKDENIKAIDTVYNAKTKLLDDDTNNQVVALQSQIDAIDAQQQADEDAKTNKEELDNIASLNLQLLAETDADKKLDIQKQLNDATQNRAERLHKAEIDTQKDSLKKQIDNIKDNAEKQKTILQQQQETEKTNIENSYNTQKSALDTQLQNVKDFYAQKTEQANLNAEAEKLIMSNSQTDIINLLNGFGDKYEESGVTLGERLVSGITPKIASIKSMLADVANAITSPKTNTTNSTNTTKKPPKTVWQNNEAKFGGWYASGGIFNQPTVIGVGEAGTEVVTPIDKLKSYVKDAISEVGGNSGNITITVPVMLDGKQIAKVTAPYNDRIQGNNLNLTGRCLGI